jgi:CubicO group peptidase (beta-lactamase class C family)
MWLVATDSVGCQGCGGDGCHRHTQHAARGPRRGLATPTRGRQHQHEVFNGMVADWDGAGGVVCSPAELAALSRWAGAAAACCAAITGVAAALWRRDPSGWIGAGGAALLSGATYWLVRLLHTAALAVGTAVLGGVPTGSGDDELHPRWWVASQCGASALALVVGALPPLLLGCLLLLIRYAFRPLGSRCSSPPPSPADILRLAPPRVCPDAEAEVGASSLHRGANEAIMRLLRYQIGYGRELGVQVFAYHHGQLAVAVVGGVFRPLEGKEEEEEEEGKEEEEEESEEGVQPRHHPVAAAGGGLRELGGWEPVRGGTLIMAYSVAKAVSASAMVLLRSQGELDFSQPCADVWPELTRRPGEHSAGPGAEAGPGPGPAVPRYQLSVAAAVSHRVGLPGTPLPLQRFYGAWARGGWERLWEEGERWAEGAPLRWWPPGCRCRYHHLSYSFIVGGLVRRSCGRHIADVVAHELAPRAGVPQQLHLGRLPRALAPRCATLEPPPAPGGGLGVWATARGQRTAWPRRALGCLESTLFRYIGNSGFWRSACYPSSNGFVTARAVARVLGALANGGALIRCRPGGRGGGGLGDDNGEGLRMARGRRRERRSGDHGAAAAAAEQKEAVVQQLVSEESVADLVAMLTDPAQALAAEPDQPSPSRLSCGFSPWYSTRIQGRNAARCFGHNGMNGCSAYADPDSGLSVCVLKTVYDPQVVYDAPGDDVADIMAVLRRELCGEEMPPPPPPPQAAAAPTAWAVAAATQKLE